LRLEGTITMKMISSTMSTSIIGVTFGSAESEPLACPLDIAMGQLPPFT
jgi:hypothetical protein